MTTEIAHGSSWAQRSVFCMAILLCGGFASHVSHAQSEPNTLEQLRSAVERPDYSNERRARYAARACDEFNDGESCFKRATLANIHAPDLGDETLQYTYFRKACLNSIGASCRKAAIMSSIGKGTKQSGIDADNFYTMGCDAGDAKSCEIMKKALEFQTRRLYAAKGDGANSSSPQNASSSKPATASFAEQSAALRQVTQLTSVGTQTCNELIRRLSPDEGKSMGELGQRWWMLLQASFRSNNRACNIVPVAISRQVEAGLVAAAPKNSTYSPPPVSPEYTSCDSTCQRQKTIRDNTPLNCYVKDGRRICNK